MTVDTQDSGASAPAVSLPPRTVAAVKKFVAEHGGSASAVIQPVGLDGVRITLVGADGVLGDQVVDDLATANAVVAAVDNVTVSEWERAITSIVTPRVGHWRKMAGWVANQTRFPKARNGLG
ncbi:hypothetical protein ABIC28_004072 [Rhodococcus sp. PvR044]|jgi:hypothetical protein|uniref:hypothetical protein n=1 Tax=Rhodococcus TaxID=1827 RepID=UPI000BD52585|nr:MULTISPECIES: hypothetical protein [Rhodococcus]MBP1158628.1 hypothetical protein [Rhodococcus sp. PvR099]MCZ4558377.1 hypothetical protein [Rhodococcus maanshanensis]PTR45516.1 hypothetical protein C8K38_101244 [Rhodococcus sp. OK611]SNX89066.1 hypothetical protein SAMN05447004_101244 [Rhodococcus sp. OK270]